MQRRQIPGIAALAAAGSDMRARQALACALHQTEFMETVADDDAPWSASGDYFVCGGASATAPTAQPRPNPGKASAWRTDIARPATVPVAVAPVTMFWSVAKS